MQRIVIAIWLISIIIENCQGSPNPSDWKSHHDRELLETYYDAHPLFPGYEQRFKDAWQKAKPELAHHSIEFLFNHAQSLHERMLKQWTKKTGISVEELNKQIEQAFLHSKLENRPDELMTYKQLFKEHPEYLNLDQLIVRSVVHQWYKRNKIFERFGGNVPNRPDKQLTSHEGLAKAPAISENRKKAKGKEKLNNGKKGIKKIVWDRANSVDLLYIFYQNKDHDREIAIRVKDRWMAMHKDYPEIREDSLMKHVSDIRRSGLQITPEEEAEMKIKYNSLPPMDEKKLLNERAARRKAPPAQRTYWSDELNAKLWYIYHMNKGDKKFAAAKMKDRWDAMHKRQTMLDGRGLINRLFRLKLRNYVPKPEDLEKAKVEYDNLEPMDEEAVKKKRIEFLRDRSAQKRQGKSVLQDNEMQSHSRAGGISMQFLHQLNIPRSLRIPSQIPQSNLYDYTPFQDQYASHLHESYYNSGSSSVGMNPDPSGSHNIEFYHGIIPHAMDPSSSEFHNFDSHYPYGESDLHALNPSSSGSHDIDLHHLYSGISSHSMDLNSSGFHNLHPYHPYGESNLHTMDLNSSGFHNLDSHNLHGESSLHTVDLNPSGFHNFDSYHPHGESSLYAFDPSSSGFHNIDCHHLHSGISSHTMDPSSSSFHNLDSHQPQAGSSLHAINPYLNEDHSSSINPSFDNIDHTSNPCHNQSSWKFH